MITLVGRDDGIECFGKSNFLHGKGAGREGNERYDNQQPPLEQLVQGEYAPAPDSSLRLVPTLVTAAPASNSRLGACDQRQPLLYEKFLKASRRTQTNTRPYHNLVHCLDAFAGRRSTEV